MEEKEIWRQMCKKGDDKKIQWRDGRLQARQKGLEQLVSSLPLAGTKPANTAIWLLTIYAMLLKALGGDVQDPLNGVPGELLLFLVFPAGIFFGIGLIALTQRQNSPTEVCRVRPCRISGSTMFSGLGHLHGGECLIVIIKGTVLPDCLPLVTIDGTGGGCRRGLRVTMY